MKPEKLEPMFRKALQTCKFFPKVAEVLEGANDAREKLDQFEAEGEWEHVLELRARYWSPDMPGGFSRGMPKLSERVRQACRAAGVFRDYENADQLHVWAHKRFVESFTAFGELEQGKHLLPDGEIKNLLTDTARAKALPAPAVDFADLHKRGLEYAEQIKAKSALLVPKPEHLPRRGPIAPEELERQKQAILSKYPTTDLLWQKVLPVACKREKGSLE
jgi:hypothetical protein